jgi:hypothetical protein
VFDTVCKPLADAEDALVDVCCLYRASDESPLLQAFLEVVRSYRQEMLKVGPESCSPHEKQDQWRGFMAASR